MEDFGYSRSEEQSKASSLIKKIFLVGATLFSIACFIYITIHAYYFVYQDKNADIETIKSPEGPIKIVEEEQSPATNNSLQINRSIYEDIFGNKKEGLKHANVKIRNAPEPALPPKLSAESLKNSVAEKSKNQKMIIYSDQENKDGALQDKDLLTKTSGENKIAVAKKIDKKRGVRVQIAAMASRNSAKEFSDKLAHLYPSLFSSVKFFTEEVDLGKRGIFYRLQIGSFFNQVEAEEFCNRYVVQTQKSKADCIVVE
jgi:uncharacterized protein Veg